MKLNLFTNTLLFPRKLNIVFLMSMISWNRKRDRKTILLTLKYLYDHNEIINITV